MNQQFGHAPGLPYGGKASAISVEADSRRRHPPALPNATTPVGSTCRTYWPSSTTTSLWTCCCRTAHRVDSPAQRTPTFGGSRAASQVAARDRQSHAPSRKRPALADVQSDEGASRTVCRAIIGRMATHWAFPGRGSALVAVALINCSCLPLPLAALAVSLSEWLTELRDYGGFVDAFRCGVP